MQPSPHDAAPASPQGPASDDTAGHRLSLPRRVAPAVALFFLAPWVGEYLNGNVSIGELPGLPILALLYGGGAVLIREVARRTGRGWPAILSLGAAYGVVEAGLVDLSMFNLDFEGLDFALLVVPGLGISAYWSYVFVLGHAVWSIGVPIALVETFVPQRRTAPWLGNVGLAVATVLYLSGAIVIGRYMRIHEGVTATVGQMVAAGAVATVFVVVALVAGGSSPARVPRRAPRPLLVGIAVFAAAGIRSVLPGTWIGLAVDVVVVVGAMIVVTRLSRRQGWTDEHRLAVAGGLLLTYAWGAFLVASFTGRTGSVELIGHGVFALMAIALLAVATRQVRRG